MNPTLLEKCDCGHDRKAHRDIECRQCKVDYSPDGRCRAGGFTNGEARLAQLNERLNDECVIAAAV